ncbi:hypothetical protein G9A89_010012 [Geosiphon pyriformis]|nr:hypothetical protein G9A89_010012 [Geosiphon pyriformis]
MAFVENSSHYLAAASSNTTLGPLMRRRRVMLAYHESEPATQLFQWALDDFLQPDLDHVFLVMVVTLPKVSNFLYSDLLMVGVGMVPNVTIQSQMPFQDTEWQKRKEQEARNQLENLSRQLYYKNITSTLIILEGNPRHELLDLCKSIKPDVVLIGERGRKKIRNLVVRSKIEHFQKKLDISVVSNAKNFESIPSFEAPSTLGKKCKLRIDRFLTRETFKKIFGAICPQRKKSFDNQVPGYSAFNTRQMDTVEIATGFLCNKLTLFEKDIQKIELNKYILITNYNGSHKVKSIARSIPAGNRIKREYLISEIKRDRIDEYAWWAMRSYCLGEENLVGHEIYAGVAVRDSKLILIVRGSRVDNEQDWSIRNNELVDYPTTNRYAIGAKVDRVFYEKFQRIHIKMTSLILSGIKEYNINTIVAVGHGSGGGNREFVQHIRTSKAICVVRVTYMDDYVPKLPSSTVGNFYEHTSVEVWIESNCECANWKAFLCVGVTLYPENMPSIILESQVSKL